MGCSIGFRSTKPQGHVGKHLPDWPKPRARTTSGTWRISSWPWMKPSVEPLRTPTKINGITGYYKASPDSSNLSVDIAPAIGLSKSESSLFARFAPRQDTCQIFSVISGPVWFVTYVLGVSATRGLPAPASVQGRWIFASYGPPGSEIFMSIPPLRGQDFHEDSPLWLSSFSVGFPLCVTPSLLWGRAAQCQSDGVSRGHDVGSQRVIAAMARRASD